MASKDKNIWGNHKIAHSNLPSREEQKMIIKSLQENKTNTQDELSCLIVLKWWNKWKIYVNYEDNPFNEFVQTKPTAIDNTILKKPNLIAELDYTIISIDIWRQLHQWYGGGPLKRKRTNKIYEIKLDILNSNNENVIKRTFNSDTTIGTLRQEMCQEMALNEEKVRIRNCYDNSIYCTQECMNQTLDDVDIMGSHKILFEIQNENGTWPTSNLCSIKTSTITNSVESTSTTIRPPISPLYVSDEDFTYEPNDSKIDNIPNIVENELEKTLIENDELNKQLNSAKDKIKSINKQHYSLEQKYLEEKKKFEQTLMKNISLEQQYTSLENKHQIEKKN